MVSLRKVLVPVVVACTFTGCAIDPEALERKREAEREHRYWFPYECRLPGGGEWHPRAENQCAGGAHP
jgi:hypothetical protein